MDNFIALSQVLLGFTLAFVVVPWLVLPRPASATTSLDVVVINFVRWLAIVVVATHVLVALRLFETTAIVVLLMVGVYFSKLRPRGWNTSRMVDEAQRCVVRVMAWADRAEARRLLANGEVLQPPAPEDVCSTPEVARPRRFGSRFIAVVLVALPVIAVLAASFALRVEDTFGSVALSPPDSYVHMTWARAITANQIYPDGIYPQGMPMVIAWLDKFGLGSHLLNTVRFFGPLIGTIVVFSLGYTALRLTRSPGAAIVAMGTFGLTGAREEWHINWIRQTGVLPQELALAVALLGVTFIALYVITKNRDHLWTIGAACVFIAMTHPLPLGVLLGIGGVVALGIGLFTRGGVIRAMEAGAVAAVSTVVGFLYVPAAMLAQVPFYGGTTNLNPLQTASDTIGGGADDPALAAGVILAPHNSITALAAVGAIVAFVFGIFAMAPKTRALGLRLMAIAIIAGVALIAYIPDFLPFDDFYTRRFANLTGPLVALGLAAGIGALSVIPFFKKVPLARATVLVGAGVLAVLMFVSTFPQEGVTARAEIEYSETVELTQTIRESHANLTYTVVGTAEQSQHVGNSGWFIQLWVFARDVGYIDESYEASASRPSLYARDPGRHIPVPTEDVYIFVEKEAFADFELPPRGATEEYYRNPDKRGRIMAATFRWAEEYRRFHSGMTVFHDGPKIRVYHLRHQVSATASDESPLFKDYEWRPGRLFNDGPTIDEELVR